MKRAISAILRTFPYFATISWKHLGAHPCLPLSVAQVRLLLQVLLPQPVLDLIAYQQRRNYAAHCSHRKRLLAQLEGLRW